MHALEANTKRNRFTWANKREDPQTLASPSLSHNPLVSVIRELKGVVPDYSVLQHRGLIRELSRRRAIFKRQLLFRDAIMWAFLVLVAHFFDPSECLEQGITPSAKGLNSDYKIKQDWIVNGIVGFQR